jgi:ribosomal-protein-alanine N-acetyltransferase
VTIRLVTLTEEHLPALARTMEDPEIVRFTRLPDPVPPGWLAQWIRKFDGPDQRAWAVVDGPEDDPEFLGYAVTGPVQREAREVELGYAVSPWARGRGVATASLRMMSRWAFAEGMVRLVALISVDNPASSRVAQKAGYTFEGVLRSVHHRGEERVDLQSWSLLPGELLGEPAEP